MDKPLLASNAALQVAALPPSLWATRTSLGKSWHSVSLQQLTADLAIRKRQPPNRHVQNPDWYSWFASYLDSMTNAFMRLNLVDPASDPQSQADLRRLATHLRELAVKSQSQRGAAAKYPRKRAILMAINDVQAQIARALLFQDYFLVALLTAILLDLLAQLSAL